MKKIKVESKISLFVLIPILIAISIALIFLYKLTFLDSTTASYRTKSNYWEIVGAFVIFIPLLFNSAASKIEYVSDILLFQDYLELIYKVRNKITKKEKIFFSDISSFEVKAKLDNETIGRSTYVKSDIETIIKLRNREDIYFSTIGSNSLTSFCSYKYVLDILKAAQMIPNFSLKLRGNCEYAIENINYFKRFGKKLPFWVGFKYQLKKMPKASKIILGISFAAFLVPIFMLIYINLPSPKLSDLEQKYMEKYNHGTYLMSKTDNYKDAILKFDEAQEIINTSPDSHYNKAHCYEKLNQCDDAIKEAQEGLKYANNKPIHYKYNNYRFIKNNYDIYLNSVIGRCSFKNKNYEMAIKAYTDIINSKNNYKYTDAYFKRGMSYYYLGDFDLAKADLTKHKEIIYECKKNEYCDIYNNLHLQNVNLWLKACDNTNQ